MTGPIRRRSHGRLFTLCMYSTVQYSYTDFISDFIQTTLYRWTPEKKRNFIRWYVIVVRYATGRPPSVPRMASTMLLLLYKRTRNWGLQSLYDHWKRWRSRKGKRRPRHLMVDPPKRLPSHRVSSLIPRSAGSHAHAFCCPRLSASSSLPATTSRIVVAVWGPDNCIRHTLPLI
jgi:hypothetical protein